MGAGLELVGLRAQYRRIQLIHAAADRRNATHVQLYRESPVVQFKYPYIYLKYLHIYLFPIAYPMFTDNVVFFSYYYLAFIVDHDDYSDTEYYIVPINSNIFDYEYAYTYFFTDYVVFFIYFIFIIDYVDPIGAQSENSLAHR